MQHRTVSCLLAGWIVFMAGCSTMQQADFYISPNGCDEWSGKRAAANTDGTDGPFKTLARARDAVRRANANRDLRIMLRGGDYVLEDTIVFGLEDSAANGRQVIFENYPLETPVISSDVKITGWKKLTGDIPGLTANVNGNVWVADVPDALGAIYALYENGKPLQRAKTERFMSPFKLKGWRELANRELGRHTKIRCPNEFDLRVFSNLNDMELFVKPTIPWTFNILSVRSIDVENHFIHTVEPASYAMSQVHHDKHFWLENTFEFLDEPGEWVYDSDSKKLYLWPKSGKPGDIVAPKLVEYIRIEGDIDYDGPKDVPVRGIVFRGLNFVRANRFKWPQGMVGRGLQHDWEAFDKSSAMIRMRGAEDCVIDDCRFVNTAATAVRLDLHCQNNRIINSTFDRVGGVGVLLAGYGPGTKNVNKRNEVVNNQFRYIGEYYWHSPAIFAWQSGENLIAHNDITHMPYTGIVVSGRIIWDRRGIGECSKTIRWDEVDQALGKKYNEEPDWYLREPFLHARKNILRRNRISRVMEKMGDGNAIYVSGCGGGNVVKRNYVYDIYENGPVGAVSALRTDDDQYETILTENIIYNCHCPAFILKHRNNQFTNNIMVNCGTQNPDVRKRHKAYIPMRLGPVTGSVIKANIFYTTDPRMTAYEYGKTYGEPSDIRQCHADYNVYYCPIDPNWHTAKLAVHQADGIEQHSFCADPCFMGIANENFCLESDSPVLKKVPHFKQISIDTIGLLKNPVR